MFLLIENQGVAPIEAFTVLGDSGTRHREGNFIGQFGSGNKHAVNVLMRHNIPFYVCLGGTTLEFYYEVENVKEADGTIRQSYPVYCQLKGGSNKKIKCGWTLEFGALDWTNVGMALREFVSNAIDCSDIMETEPVVKPEPNKRSKKNTTRIFVDFSHPEVKEYYRDLGKNFLHFSADPSQVNQTFLKKDPDEVGCIVYREGVKIAALRATKRAAFDYNLTKDEIRIDECRNSDEFALRARIAQLINKAPKAILTEFFEILADGEVYEATLDDFYLSYTEGQAEQDNWKEAWTDFAGDAVIATETQASSPVTQHVRAKGHTVKCVKSDSFVKAAKKFGVKDLVSVAGHHAASGKIECPATSEAVQAVGQVWEWLKAANMTNRKECPIICSFREIMEGESECLGYHEIGTDKVFLRDDLGGKLALKTALEEVVHYVTGSGDCSRDFQQFLLDMVVEQATQEVFV